MRRKVISGICRHGIVRRMQPMPLRHPAGGSCAGAESRGGLRTAADALPGRLEDGERRLVEQVGHDRALHAAGERVPDTGGAVVQVEAAVEERLDGVQLGDGERAGAPGDVPGPGGLVHRGGPGAVVGPALVHGGPPGGPAGGVQAADGVEELGEGGVHRRGGHGAAVEEPGRRGR